MDRVKLLRGHPTVNGIDFVEVVDAAQTVIDVHFFNPVTGLDVVVESVSIAGGDAIPEVQVTSMDWTLPSGDVLRLQVAAPGDFSSYTLALHPAASVPSGSPTLDPYFDHALFSS